MNPGTDDLIARNSVFGWIALATGLILLIPLIVMQFTEEVSWNSVDFIVMGTLLFGAGSLFVLLSRWFPRKRRIIAGAIVTAAFLYVWAELSVGVLTNLGS